MDQTQDRSFGWFGRAWVVGVVLYATVRAVIVWPTLGGFGVNPWIFLAIDVGTAWPYAVGQISIVQGLRGRKWRRVQGWSLVTLASFLAPYVYIVGAGSGEMPLVAYVIVGLLVVLLGAVSILRIVKELKVTVAPVEA